MTGMKLLAGSGLVAAGIGLTETWEAWEKLGLAGILLAGLIALYVSGERTRLRHDKDLAERERMLRDTLEKVAAAGQRQADFIGICTAKLTDVENAIVHCKTMNEVARTRRERGA